MDINCRKLNCVHNKKCVCTAKTINIDKNSICDSFVEDKDKPVEDLSKTMFQKTPEYENFRHIKDANIECYTHCIFNKEGKCLANGIIVLDGDETALCGTYLKRVDKRSNKFNTKS